MTTHGQLTAKRLGWAEIMIGGLLVLVSPVAGELIYLAVVIALCCLIAPGAILLCAGRWGWLAQILVLPFVAMVVVTIGELLRSI